MIAAAGLLSEPIANLREMLASSPTFQAWCGVDDETDPVAAARERVHVMVAPANAERPFAMVDFGEFTRERTSLTNRTKFQTRSSSNLILWFQADAGSDLDEPDATIDFSNEVGSVWLDLELAAGNQNTPTLALYQIELTVAPARVEEEKRATAGDYFECALACYFTRTPAHG